MYINELNIIPTYKCNLNCFFCFFSELRSQDTKTLLDPMILEYILAVLKNEGNTIDTVNIYGGEIGLLNYDYLFDLIKVVKKIFPKTIIEFVTNLLDPPEWFSELQKVGRLNTSWEGLRFKKDDYLFKKWLENFLFFQKKKNVGLISLVTNQWIEVEKVLETKIKPQILVVAPLYVREEWNSFLKKKVLQYVIEPKQYVFWVKKMIRKFNVTPINSAFKNLLTTFHIHPDGSVRIVTYSKLGYPYEREITISSFEELKKENVLTLSPKFFQILHENIFEPCVSCNTPESCLAEIKYPGICVGR